MSSPSDFGPEVWPPGESVLRVCFLRGKPELRDHKVTVAKRWFYRPLGVSLDFGAAPSYRSSVASGNDQIRFGFSTLGIARWSVRTATSRRATWELSMNFQGCRIESSKAGL